MSARPVARVLFGRTSFPSTFFTQTSSRQTELLQPRYFTSTPILQSKSSLSSSRSIFSIFSKPPKPKTPFFQSKRFNTTDAKPPNGTAHLTLGQKWRQISKEYGYSAVGVYLLLTALDLPFCFLFVRTIGSEKIAHYEHKVIEGFWSLMPDSIRQYRPKELKSSNDDIAGSIDSLAHGEGLKQVEAETGANGQAKTVSIWTELALAYAVHKSLIFIRIPVAVALTPRIVKQLRAWGFNIGKKGGVQQSVRDARQNLRDRRKGKSKLDD